MAIQEILNSIGHYSSQDVLLFEKYTTPRIFRKNEVLLNEGEICRSVYYILSGSFFQFLSNEITETIIDLHLPKEWMFNHSSLIGQTPSNTTIKAFSKADVIELSLNNLHNLIAKIAIFFEFGEDF